MKLIVFFLEFIINLSHITNNPGRQKNILTKLSNTPLASTNPKSLPIVKLINTNANNPTTVVIELLEIALNESSKFDNKMKSLFFIEDYYCSNAVLDSLEVFKYRKKDWNYE